MKLITSADIEGLRNDQVLQNFTSPSGVMLPGVHVVALYGGTIYQGIVRANPGHWTQSSVQQLKSDGHYCDQAVHLCYVKKSPRSVHVDYYRRFEIDASNVFTMSNLRFFDTYETDLEVLCGMGLIIPYDIVHHSMIPPNFTAPLRSFLPWETKTTSGVSAPCICKRCNSKNDFAEPNQKDGSYVCFECR